MWQKATAGMGLEAPGTMEVLIRQWRVFLNSGKLRRAANDAHRAGMAPFKTYPREEVLRLNSLQAAYFGKNVEIFEPPLPEGVPERLERIVRTAGIGPHVSVLDVGTGTGILIPLIQKYAPSYVYANDLSDAMLDFVRDHYPSVITVLGDVADLALPDGSVGVALINACYSNLIDKPRAFTNLRRMLRPGGRLVISHPLGRSFVRFLKENVPFPLDDFPSDESGAVELFAPYGFQVTLFVDEDELYILRLQADSRERADLS
jgi:SAM-dependent methyltransferase